MTLSELRTAVSFFLFEPPLLAISERVPILRNHCRGWRRTHPYDRANGIETSGFLPVSMLQSDPALAEQMNPYAGCQPSVLRRALQTLPPVGDYTFVDLGCGKGRALAVASEFPFRHVVGVDLSDRLAQVARSNARVLRKRYPERPSIEVEVGNALTFSLPDDRKKRVVYCLFNSFPRPVMGRFVDHLAHELRNGTEHVFFVYYNPFVNEPLDECPALVRYSAETYRTDPSEEGFGPDCLDTVVIWQSIPSGIPARPGADRRVFSPPGTTQAELAD